MPLCLKDVSSLFNKEPVILDIFGERRLYSVCPASLLLFMFRCDHMSGAENSHLPNDVKKEGEKSHVLVIKIRPIWSFN